MTDSVMHDPTAEWLVENFSLETPWRRPAPVSAPVSAPGCEHAGQVDPEPVRWRRARAVSRVVGQVAPYASALLWVGALAAAEETG